MTEEVTMQAGEVGHQVSVLTGHEGPVSFVDFHRQIPEILLSSSLDGTCRIWDAKRSGGCLHILKPIAQNATSAYGLRGSILVPEGTAEARNSVQQERTGEHSHVAQNEVPQSSQATHYISLWLLHI